MIIDTHSHIDFETDEELVKVLENAEKAGVKGIIIPGVEPEGFSRIMDLVEKYSQVYAAIGIHPSEVHKYNDTVEQKIIELLQHEKVVAVGEIGLDYYWDRSFIDLQKDIFRKQLELAQKFSKSIIVHDREAHQDSFEVLKDVDIRISPVIMHCFSGSVEFAEQCLKKGFYIAFGGVLTFKNAKKIKEVAKIVPLDKILIETDAPYLTPVPHRGEKNEPAYTKFVVEEIAKIKDISIEEVEAFSTKNAIEAFKMEQFNV